MSTVARTEPTNPLFEGTRGMWTCEALIGALFLLAGAVGLAAGVGVLMPWLPLATAAGGSAYVLVVPRRRYRRWRWALHEEEVDLQQGVWSVTRTIVPITRIQHVSVERTGWTDLFDTVRVHVHTAAGKTTIPGLHPAQAADVRDRILARLRTPDDL